MEGNLVKGKKIPSFRCPTPICGVSFHSVYNLNRYLLIAGKEKKIIMDDVVKQKIIKYFVLDGFSPERQDKMLLLIDEIIRTRIETRILRILNEKDSDEVDALLANENELLTKKNFQEEAFLEFWQSKIPNFREIIREEVAGVREDLREITNKLKEKHKKNVSAFDEVMESQIVDGAKELVSYYTKIDGSVMDVGGLFISLAYSQLSKELTLLEKRKWLFEKVIAWLGNFMGGLWFTILIFVIALHLQRKGFISVIPDWIDAYIPNWFKEFGLSTQLLLSLVIPVGTLMLLVVISIFKANFLKKEILRRQ